MVASVPDEVRYSGIDPERASVEFEVRLLSFPSVAIEKAQIEANGKDTQMGKKIFVGNLSFEATEQELMDFFAQDGREVERVSIITDRETGRPRGFAFVEMGSDSAAQEAIAALDGADMNGRPLRVNEAHDKPRGAGGGGGGGGGRGGYGGGGGGGGGGRGGRGGGGGYGGGGGRY